LGLSPLLAGVRGATLSAAPRFRREFVDLSGKVLSRPLSLRLATGRRGEIALTLDLGVLEALRPGAKLAGDGLAELLQL